MKDSDFKYQYYKIGTLFLREVDPYVYYHYKLDPRENFALISWKWNEIDLSLEIYLPMKNNEKYKSINEYTHSYVSDNKIEGYKNKLQKFNINLK